MVLTAAVLVGGLGVLLAVLGNPRNSGICVSCFLENVAGALGLHGDTRMMYLRPEVPGFLLGAAMMALATGGFRGRGGSSPLVRFFIGFFIMVGCAMFIGCPVKLVLRLGAGDLTAVAGVAGLVAGVVTGVGYLRGGFSLGTAQPRPLFGALLLPAAGLAATAAVVIQPGFLGRSVSGPGAAHAFWLWSLGAGLVIGVASQASRFCITGSIRNFLLTRSREPLLALGAVTGTALAASLLTGRFHLGLNDQPGSHPDHLWNFLGMYLAGFGGTLIEGCPFRQLILAGEGDTDAGTSLMGMLVAGGLVYSWSIRSTSAGPTTAGKAAVLVGLLFCFAAAAANRRRG
jgi:YedE family putative selenium metabolism protein